MHGRMLAHEFLDGINRVEATRPEVLVVPGIFADGNGQAHTVQFHHLLRARGGKVALLVEDIVKRQQALVLLEQEAAAIEKNSGIDGLLAGVAACRQRNASHDRGWQPGGGSGQLVHGRTAAGQKAWFLKEVGGRIAADGEL